MSFLSRIERLAIRLVEHSRQEVVPCEVVYRGKTVHLSYADGTQATFDVDRYCPGFEYLNRVTQAVAEALGREHGVEARHELLKKYAEAIEKADQLNDEKRQEISHLSYLNGVNEVEKQGYGFLSWLFK